MNSFTDFFRDSQVPEWKKWYLDLDGLKDALHAVATGDSSSTPTKDDVRRTALEQESRSPFLTAAEVTDAHRSAMQRLRANGTRVRVGCDLWLDENGTPTVQAGDHWIAAPRNRADVNILLFPRNAIVRLRPESSHSEKGPLPRRASMSAPRPNEPLDPTIGSSPQLSRISSFHSLTQGSATEALPASLHRNGLELSLGLWPKTSNGIPADIDAVQEAFHSRGASASDAVAARDDAGIDPHRNDSFVVDPRSSSMAKAPDPSSVDASQRAAFIQTVRSKHGLWIVTIDGKQLAADVDVAMLSAYAVTLGVEKVLDDFDLIADVYAALSEVWTRELRKVSKFYGRQAALVAGSVAACVETSKRAARQSPRERQHFAAGFRDTFSALDALQHFRDLNSVAVFRSLDEFERITGHDVMSSLGRQLRRVSFVAKNVNSQTALMKLRELLAEAALPYMWPSTTIDSFLERSAEESSFTFRHKRSAFNVAIGTMMGLTVSLLLAAAVDFFEEQQPLIVNNNGGALASYHFIITLGIILVFAVFAGVVEACEHMSVNYVFLLELDASDHWTGRELLRNVMVYVTLWTACLYGFMRTAKAELRGDVNAGWAWVWSYVVWGCLILTWVLFQVKHPPTRKRWFLVTLGHVVTAPLFPVRFRDFVIGLMLMSSAEILNQFQLIWCNLQIPGMGWDCSAASSMKLFVLAALPPIWRILQCIRSYMAPLPHRRSAFPHLFNAGKYVVGMIVSTLAMGYQLQGRFNPSDSMGYDAMFYTYIAVSIFNSVFRSFWDFFVNGAFIPAVNIVETDRRRHDRMVKLFGAEQVHVGSEGYAELSLAAPKKLHVCIGGSDGNDTDEDDEKIESPLTSKWPSPEAPADELWALRTDSLHVEEHHSNVCGWTWWPIRLTHLSTPTYAAVFSYNVFARFWWVFGVFYTQSALWTPLITIVVECLRRFVILCVRIEVEQVANVENFKVTVAAPAAVRPGAGPTRGLLSTTAWDSASGELALSAESIASEHVLVKSSQVDRFFSLLPHEEKVAVMQLTLAFVPSTRKFVGRAGEGKARWFAERPEDVKVLALLQRAGSRSLSQYAHDCAASSSAAAS